MATHEADSGPSAKRSLGNAGTGLSDAGASFISAHCSPFSPPHEIVTGPAKVPDPRTHDATCTAYIWQNFDIPVTAAGQVVIMNPDPLAPLPVAWGADDSDFSQPRDAKFWATTYENVGIADMMCNIKALAENSSQHRIVGCGMKIWVTKDVSKQSQGHIEAGHFKISRAQYKGVNGFKRQAPATGTGTAAAVPQIDGIQSYYKAREEDWSRSGAFGTAYNNPTPARLLSSIERARTQEMGFLPADEGVTLRWTDSHEFEFQDTVYRSIMAPSKTAFTNGYLPFAATHNNKAGPQVGTGSIGTGYAGRVMHDRDSAAAGVAGDEGFLAEAAPYEAIGMNQTYYFIPTAYTPQTFQGSLGLPNLNSVGTSKLGYFECNVGSNALYPGDRRGTFYQNGCADASSFPDVYAVEEYLDWADDKKNFGNGLYAYINGVDASQRLTVQIVWHVEYKPTYQALDRGLPSPVDMSFDQLSVLAGDPVSFPVVVKGHSFFKSLFRGLKQAATGAARVLGIASKVAAFVPLPQAQMASGLMGSAGMIAGNIGSVF